MYCVKCNGMYVVKSSLEFTLLEGEEGRERALRFPDRKGAQDVADWLNNFLPRYPYEVKPYE